MREKLLRALALFVGAVACSFPVAAQWTNGQNAEYVVGQPDFVSNGSAGSQNELRNPQGVAVDVTNGKLYVADTENHRVLRFGYPLTGNQPNAEVVLGQADFTSTSANRGGLVGANTMCQPGGLAVDSTGRLWVADCSNKRVLRFDTAYSKTDGADADGVLGQADFTSDSSATSVAGMDNPQGVAVDSSGAVWVADRDNSRVLRFDGASGKLNGADADGVLGQADFTSNGPATSQGGMNFPCGVAIDSAGALWVVDTDNHRVVRFDNASSKSDGANADGVLGQADFTSNSGTVTQSGMYYPYGSPAVDNDGRLYLPDTSNHRVLMFDDAATQANGGNADNVLGQADFTSNSTATTQDGMYYPFGVCVDSTNHLLVLADYSNSRVLQFAASGTLPVELAVFGVE